MSTSTIRITAPLARDARHFTDTGGGAWLGLRLQLREGTAEALLRYGTGAAAQHITAAAARRYRRGEAVTVYATGWTWDAHHGVLMLSGVDRVELIPVGLDRLTPDHSPTEEAPA